MMKFFRLSAATVLSCFLSLIGLAQESGKDLEHSKDSIETIKKNLAEKKAVLLDVREESEWNSGHLQQAVLVPLSKLRAGTDPKSIAKELDTKKIVYCHCRAGGRALTAAETLKKLGYDVRPLKQ